MNQAVIMHVEPDIPNSMDSPPRRGAPWQVWVVLALLASAVAWGVATRGGNATASAPDLVHWSHDLDASRMQAVQDQRPIYLIFTADWCPPCQQMKKEVYTDPAVAAVLNERYIPVKVDMTDPQNAAANALYNAYHINGTPTLIILSPDGKELARSYGKDAPELLQWLGS